MCSGSSASASSRSRARSAGALARDAVDQVERDVVEAGITQEAERASDVVRPGRPVEHLEQLRLERLRAERDAVDPAPAKQCGELGGHGLRVRLDRQLVARRQRGEQALERGRLGERRRAAAEVHRLGPRVEQAALELELRAAAHRRSASCSSSRPTTVTKSQ